MKKRYFTWILLLVICFSLSACGTVKNEAPANQAEKGKEENEKPTEKSKQKEEEDSKHSEGECEEEKLNLDRVADVSFPVSGLNLYELADIDENKYEIIILDVEPDKILFTANQEREGTRAEGLAMETEGLYVYKRQEKQVTKIAEFDHWYITGEGIMFGDKYMCMGIKLDGEDKKFSIFYGDEKGVSEIHSGNNTKFFNRWPKLVKLDSEILLIEPELDPERESETIKKVHFLKFQNDHFVDANISVPEEYRILETRTTYNKTHFATFWENSKDEQAAFIVMDKNGNKTIIPFPKKYKLMNFALIENNIIASVQVEEEYTYKIVVFDVEKKTVHARNSIQFKKMRTLASDGKVLICMDDPNHPRLKILEYKDGTLQMGTVLTEIPEKKLENNFFIEESGSNIMIYFASKGPFYEIERQ